MFRFATLCGTLLLLALSVPAQAVGVTYTVTRTDDPPPGACLPNDCSLREAIDAASADPATFDNIDIGPGTYQVSAPMLTIHGGLIIFGGGMTQTIIQGDGSADLFRLDTTAYFSMQNVTIDAGGRTEFNAVSGSDVGLFRVRAPNPAGRIFVRGTTSAATFNFGESEAAAPIDCGMLDRCLIFDSRIAYLHSSYDSFPPINATDIELQRVTIDGALAPGAASGIEVGTSATVVITDTTITGTSRGASFSGFDIFGDADIDILRLKYLANAQPLRLHDLATVKDSQFTDNSADLNHPNPGAIDIDAGAPVTIDDSSFVNNKGSADVGGAVRIAGDAMLSVRNSTFSGNGFLADSVGISGSRGGAIGFNTDSGNVTLSVQHVTIVAPSFAPIGVSGSALGGFGAAADVSMQVFNSLLRGTCTYAAGALSTAVGNIESSGDSCDFDHATNIVNASSVALALGTLGMHGGHTPTYLPAPNSIAIDAGNDGMPCIPRDQRGYPRPLGAGCDVGAVEAGDVIFADDFD
jgi:CSLREA domain-containing protein